MSKISNDAIVKFSPVSDHLVYNYRDSDWKWDSSDFFSIRTLDYNFSTLWKEYSPNGKFLVDWDFYDVSYKPNVWDISSNKYITSLTDSNVVKAVISDDSKYCATINDNDIGFSLWETDKWTLLKYYPDVVFCGFMNKGSSFLCKSNSDWCVLDTKTGYVGHRITGSNLPTSDIIASKANCLVEIQDIGYENDKANIWDINTARIRFTIDSLASFFNIFFPKVQIAFDEEHAISYHGSYKEGYKTIVWDLNTGNTLLKIPGVTIKTKNISEFVTVSEGVVAGYDKFGNLKYTLPSNEDFGDLSPDNNLLVTYNAHTGLNLWDANTGKFKSNFDGQNNEIRSVNFHQNNSVILSISKEGFCQLWSSKTMRELLTLVKFDTTCIGISNNGFYKSSPSATSQLYYIRGLQTIGFDQLDIKYNRPDKVLTALGEAFGNPDTALIRSYYRAWQKRVKKLGVDTTSFKEGFSFPESDIQNREEIAYEQTQSELKLRIVGKDSESALDRFNVWVNEVPVFGQRGISIRARGRNSLDTVVTVQLLEGENKIETSVLTVGGIESYRIPLFVKYTPAETKPEKLYFVGIGVDRYSQSGHDLKYSVKDIRDLSLALKKKHGNNLIIDTLFDQQVNRERLMALKKKLLQSGVNDKVIVSFSGHGLLDKNYNYYLATHGVDFQNPAKGGIPYEDLEWLLDSIPARKKLLLLDACHSGEVDKEELVAINGMKDEGTKGVDLVYSYQPTLGMKNSFELMQELFANVNRGTGATVISASGGTQFAREDGALRNGVFTYSILELMEKKPEVTVSELKTQVGKRVVELTNGLQKPTSRNETLEFDWRVW